MDKHAAGVILFIAMVATIVAVDILFFRHHLRERLISNIGIALVFVAFYLRFVHR